VTQEQHTLRDEVEFAGVGLHTGAMTRLSIKPQPISTGRRFRFGEGGPLLPALAEYVVETRRATVLGIGDRRISTVEHLMAALFALGVDNALIEIEGEEIPALDGSAAIFAEQLARAGLRAQGAPRATLVIDSPSVFREGEALLIVLPSDEFKITVCVEFEPPVGSQFFATTVNAETFRSEIAPARTFGYVHEVEALLAAGLARGGSLDNALVFGPEGPLVPLRWPNEVVRHKALDLIGDLALLGAWPQAEFVSIKSGHRVHAAASRALRERAFPRMAAL
jgi:UDP-3-O-[3-hydroxymyristoyl] N-acetylglucosamine deacetylase